MDIDGTLLSSSEYHLESWRFVLKKYNILRTDQEILIHFGKPTTILSRDLLGNQYSNLVDQIAEEKTKYFVNQIENMQLFSGVQETLELIANFGYSICFASSNYNYVIKKMMDKFSWNKLAVGYIGTDDIIHGKPDPEMLLKAMDLIKIPPSECVMIGDSIYDIQAGKKANTHTIAVCTGTTPRSILKQFTPELIIESFNELSKYLPLKL